MKNNLYLIFLSFFLFLNGCDTFRPLSISQVGSIEKLENVEVKAFGKLFNGSRIHLKFSVVNGRDVSLRLDSDGSFIVVPGSEKFFLSMVSPELSTTTFPPGGASFEVSLSEDQYRKFFLPSEIDKLVGSLVLRTKNGRREEWRFRIDED